MKPPYFFSLFLSLSFSLFISIYLNNETCFINLYFLFFYLFTKVNLSSRNIYKGLSFSFVVMEYESLIQYVGCTVRLILKNDFWYKGKVISAENGDFTFVDIKGKTISVDPNFIIFIEEVKGSETTKTK